MVDYKQARYRRPDVGAGRRLRQGVVVALSLLHCLAFPALADQSPALSVSEQSVRVGIYANSPKVGLGEDGRPEGIFVDIIEAIAEREGWQLEYVPGSWQEGLNRLSTGQIDLMPDVARTADRTQLFAFHDEPALSSWHQIYASSNSGIRSIIDLNGRSVAVLDGSAQQSQLENMAEGFDIAVRLLPFRDFGSAFSAVHSGQADAVVTNQFFGEHHANDLGLEDTAVIFAPSRLFFAAPLTGRTHLLEAINHHLIAFKQDPDSPYYASLERWADNPPLTTWPNWLPAAAAAIAVLLGGSVTLVFVLRNQVQAKTHQVYNQAREHTRQLERRVRDRTQELSETSTFFQALIDQVPSLIYYKNNQLRFTGCNKAYEQAFGIRREEIIGKTVHDLEFVSSSDSRKFEMEQKRLLESGGQIRREVRLQFADSTRHEMLYSAARIIGPEERPLGIVGLLVDITHQKRVEAELAVARDKAEATDRLKSAFLATMSHELRTPLNSIIGFTGILLQELAGPLNEEQSKQLTMVRNSSEHLLTLINDILDISRIEAGEMTLSSEPFSLLESVDKVVEIIRPLAERKNITLEIDQRTDPGDRMGDLRRVEQILFNLIGNAVKFTNSGSVKITIDTDDSEGKESVIIAVQDSGIGIREQDMQSLFLPFHQIDSTLSRKHQGTGLGLVICKRLTSMMDGEVRVSSRRGVGTTFTVELPLAAATATGEGT